MDELMEIGGTRVLCYAKEGLVLAREADINDLLSAAFSCEVDLHTCRAA